MLSRNTWAVYQASWNEFFFVHEPNEKRVLSHFGDLFIFAKPATLEKFRLRMTKLVVFKTCEQFSRRLFVVYLGFDSVEESER